MTQNNNLIFEYIKCIYYDITTYTLWFQDVVPTGVRLVIVTIDNCLYMVLAESATTIL